MELFVLAIVVFVGVYIIFIRSANKSVESLNVTKEEVTPVPVVEEVVKEKKTRKPRAKKADVVNVEVPAKKTRKPRSKKI
jgi:hypothetical protein